MIVVANGTVYHKGETVGKIRYSWTTQRWEFSVPGSPTPLLSAKWRKGMLVQLRRKYPDPPAGGRGLLYPTTVTLKL